MKNRWIGCLACCFLLGVSALPGAAQKAAIFTGPVHLQVDNLKTPLGIDDPTPEFSWQLQDPARGARQTAYEVFVASRESLLKEGKADVWASGRVASDSSIHIHYAGTVLKPSTRYFWRVKVWGASGQPYAESNFSWATVARGYIELCR